MESKIFHTIDEQIKKQISRGLIIHDIDKVRDILEKENYYNLFNGYKKLFLTEFDDAAEEKYKDGVLFEEIYALYLFDRELRNLLMRYILEIENNIKSLLAYSFSEQYGHENYLKIHNFNTLLNKYEKKSKAQKLGEVSDLIARIQQEIARQLSKNNPMISHYMLDYGYIPLWVLVNSLTFGTISTFYYNLKDKDANNISRKFSLKPHVLKSVLSLLTLFRNACAHDERLFNLKAVHKNQYPINIPTLDIHKKMEIQVNKGNNPLYGKNDLFAVVLIFKTLLPYKSFDYFYRSLDNLINELSNHLRSISINDIEKEMGFISDWRKVYNV